MMPATHIKPGKLLGDLIAIDDQNLATVLVSGIELDSRSVVPGDVFIACKGFVVDGRNFIDQAIAAGAVAVLAESGVEPEWSVNSERNGVPVVVVANLTQQLSEIAGRFFNHPSKDLSVLAVTGTNGKTSCTQIVMQLLNAMQNSCAVIGTLGTGVDGQIDAGINTTPDAIHIQRLLSGWRASNIDTVAMEVSSHGIEQGRVAALQFELALFTNLTRDHLDYHGDMQAYAQAKAELFKYAGLKKAVINADDDFAEQLLAVIDPQVDVLTYSIAASAGADVWVENVRYHDRGVSAQLHSPWGQVALQSPLMGAFNLSNVVAAIACLALMSHPVENIIAAVTKLETIAGRMERISSDADITVVVDYAHTSDALEKALQAMRLHSQGKLWCVFGCGGDRDPGKRPQMGAVAQRYADYVVVTSDNPRSEKPIDIINEILGGVDRPALVEERRAVAIEFAIANADAGDSVLIAGKGHENYQLVGDQRLPFSDIKQAQLALSNRVAKRKGDL